MDILERMDSNMNHTPTPWKLNKAGSQKTIYINTADEEGLYLADLQNCQGTETTEANAEFIVRACNSHDDLVKALKEVKEQIGEVFYSQKQDNPEHDAAIDRIVSVVGEALAKAEGKGKYND